MDWIWSGGREIKSGNDYILLAKSLIIFKNPMSTETIIAISIGAYFEYGLLQFDDSKND